MVELKIFHSHMEIALTQRKEAQFREGQHIIIGLDESVRAVKGVIRLLFWRGRREGDVVFGQVQAAEMTGSPIHTTNPTTVSRGVSCVHVHGKHERPSNAREKETTFFCDLNPAAASEGTVAIKRRVKRGCGRIC